MTCLGLNSARDPITKMMRKEGIGKEWLQIRENEEEEEEKEDGGDGER